MPFGNAVGEGFVNGLISKITVADLGPGDGIFVYSTSTPQLHTLIAAITGAAGSDGAGNPFEEGVSAYVYTGGNWYSLQLGSITVGATTYAGFFSQNLTDPPFIPGGMLVASSAVGSFTQIYSGLSDNTETGAIITVTDSLGSGDPAGEILMTGDVVMQDNLTVNGIFTNGGSTGSGSNGGVTSGPSGTVNAFPAAGPNHTHAEFHTHPL